MYKNNEKEARGTHSQGEGSYCIFNKLHRTGCSCGALGRALYTQYWGNSREIKYFILWIETISISCRCYCKLNFPTATNLDPDDRRTRTLAVLRNCKLGQETHTSTHSIYSVYFLSPLALMLVFKVALLSGQRLYNENLPGGTEVFCVDWPTTIKFIATGSPLYLINLIS